MMMSQNLMKFPGRNCSKKKSRDGGKISCKFLLLGDFLREHVRQDNNAKSAAKLWLKASSAAMKFSNLA